MGDLGDEDGRVQMLSLDVGIEPSDAFRATSSSRYHNPWASSRFRFVPFDFAREPDEIIFKYVIEPGEWLSASISDASPPHSLNLSMSELFSTVIGSLSKGGKVRCFLQCAAL